MVKAASKEKQLRQEDFGPYRCHRDITHHRLRYMSDEVFGGGYSEKPNCFILLYIEPWRTPIKYPNAVWFSFSFFNSDEFEAMREKFLIKSKEVTVKEDPVVSVCSYVSTHSETVRYDDINMGTKYSSCEQAGSIYIPSEFIENDPPRAMRIKIDWHRSTI